MIKIIIPYLIITLILSTSAHALQEIYIDTPKLCVKLEVVENNKVYLKSTANNCPALQGKMPVKVKDGITKVAIYVDDVLWKKQDVAVNSFNMDNIQGAMDKAKSYGEKIKIPENVHQKQGEEQASKTYEYYNSPEFQARLENEKERLKSTLFAGVIPDSISGNYYADSKEAGNGNARRMLSSSERIYIFISSSVPNTTVRNYAFALEKLKDPSISMVMRGFIDGAKYVKPTIKYVSGLLLKDSSCNFLSGKCEMLRTGINIDPLLFAKYKINKVPAVVYVPHVSVVDIDMSEGHEQNAKVSGEYYTVYGDAALDYLLEVVYKETKSKSVENVVSILRKGFY